MDLEDYMSDLSDFENDSDNDDEFVPEGNDSAEDSENPHDSDDSVQEEAEPLGVDDPNTILLSKDKKIQYSKEPFCFIILIIITIVIISTNCLCYLTVYKHSYDIFVIH